MLRLPWCLSKGIYLSQSVQSTVCSEFAGVSYTRTDAKAVLRTRLDILSTERPAKTRRAAGGQDCSGLIRGGQPPRTANRVQSYPRRLAPVTPFRQVFAPAWAEEQGACFQNYPCELAKVGSVIVVCAVESMTKIARQAKHRNTALFSQLGGQIF